MTKHEFDPRMTEQREYELLCFPTPKNDEIFTLTLFLIGFVESHPNQIFTADEIIKSLAKQDVSVSSAQCSKLLPQLEHVEIVKRGSKQTKYRSTAPHLEPTLEGLTLEKELVDDTLGQQARADFYYLVTTRGQALSKKNRAIRHF